MLRKALVTAVVLIASGALVPAAFGGGDPVAPEPPPEPGGGLDPSPQRVVRLRCPEPNVANALDPIALQGGKGYVRFRVVTLYGADLLYARRPGDIGTSRGRDIVDGIHDPPGTHRISLRLEKGRWLIGCFDLDQGFHTRDHPPRHYDEIKVVRPD